MRAGKLPTEWLEHLAIPKVHWKAYLHAIPIDCAYRETIRDYVSDIVGNVVKPRGLLLFGDPSMGKSAIGAIILKVAAAHDIIGYWITARKIPGYEINNTMFNDEETVMERAQRVPILVIDELQIGETVKYTEHAAENLIRHRIDEQLCTIITTNHASIDLPKLYPELSAVLKEAVHPVKISGHNFRDAIAKELKG